MASAHLAEHLWLTGEELDDEDQSVPAAGREEDHAGAMSDRQDHAPAEREGRSHRGAGCRSGIRR